MWRLVTIRANRRAGVTIKSPGLTRRHQPGTALKMGLRKKNKDQEDAERDFGLVEPVLDDEPIVPRRKRRLFIACACILGAKGPRRLGNKTSPQLNMHLV